MRLTGHRFAFITAFLVVAVTVSVMAGGRSRRAHGDMAARIETVFGEPGGGAKTSGLMAIPSAVGLFHKAGVMSGPLLRVTEKADATATAGAVLDILKRRTL